MHARGWKRFLLDHVLSGVLVILCLGLSIATPNFLTAENLLYVLRQVSMEGIIAMGMTMLIIAGEIDLSVGSTAALAGCLMAWLVMHSLPIPLAFPIVLAMGCSIGTFTGMMRTRYGVPTFITTLALMTGLQGAALILTGGFPLTPFPAWYSGLGGSVGGVPVPAIILVAVFGVVHFIMKNTTFGRAIYAIGGNAEAARLCGINVTRVRITALAATGGLAALAGVILSSRIMTGAPGATTGWELNAITAVIIGGSSFVGGSGTVFGTLVGILFIGVMVNGMVLLNVPINYQLVVKGLLILIAVWLTQLRERMA